MKEQFVAEQYWPCGEPAANLRAILIGKMLQASISGDKTLARDIKIIWQQLTGMVDPKKSRSKMTDKEIKLALLGFVPK